MRQLSVGQLKQWLDETPERPLILDVRQPWEHAICQLEGSTLLPMGQVPARLESLDREQAVVVVCHHGIRSQQVAYFLDQQGFPRVYNLQGGIQAWAREIDPSMATY